MVDEVFADMSKKFQLLESEYEANLTKDELDALIKNGFNSLENEIIYSKTLPGKIRKVVNSLSMQTWITIILIAGIGVILVFVLFLICYFIKACKDAKDRYDILKQKGNKHHSRKR